MTTRKDYIRQTALFTMGGLNDPRFEPEIVLGTAQPQKHKEKSVSKYIVSIRRALQYFLEASRLLDKTVTIKCGPMNDV